MPYIKEQSVNFKLNGLQRRLRKMFVSVSNEEGGKRILAEVSTPTLNNIVYVFF